MDSYAHILTVMVSSNATTGDITSLNADVKNTWRVINVPVHADASMKKEITLTSATNVASVLATVADALEDSWCPVNLEASSAMCARTVSS